MVRKLIIGLTGFVIVIGSIGVFIFYRRLPKTAFPNPQASGSVHYYDNPKISLTHIQMMVFYFVPQDHRDKIYTEWQSTLRRVMDEVVTFHASQFKNQSGFTYRLYPQPIIGQETVAGYAKDDTPTEPKSLGRIVQELDHRVFEMKGDLYRADYSPIPADNYTMKFIFYEADPPRLTQVSETGEIGGYSDQNTALVARKIITDPPNKPYGSSITYHEIGHMMGFPEGYDYQTNQPTTNDIMGSGRSRPLNQNYIEPAKLKNMGVL